MRLWPGKAPGSENWSIPESIIDRGGSRIATNVSDPTLTVYLPDASESTGAAIIVAPGGALQALSIDSEGTKVAEWLNSKGIAAFVLKYRLRQQQPGASRIAAPPPGPREELKIVNGNANPAPGDAVLDEVLQMGIADAQQALRLVRKNAADWHVDPKRVGLMGFSAGGGVSVGAVLADEPGASADFLISVYGPSLQDVHVPVDAPPLFIAVGSNHFNVTNGCLALFAEWKKAGKAGGNSRLRRGERRLRDVKTRHPGGHLAGSPVWTGCNSTSCSGPDPAGLNDSNSFSDHRRSLLEYYPNRHIQLRELLLKTSLNGDGRRTWIRPKTAAALVALTGCLALSISQSALAQAPAPAPEGGGRGRGARFAQDPRAQTRTYHFEDTNEDLPYSIYVSTKVKPDQKAPMIVTLHGLGGPQTIMMGKAAIDLAEEGGYILVAPMGYNVSGWYGTPAFARGAGRGRGNGAPGADADGRGGSTRGCRKRSRTSAPSAAQVPR